MNPVVGRQIESLQHQGKKSQRQWDDAKEQSMEGHPHSREVKRPRELQQQNEDSKTIVQIWFPNCGANNNGSAHGKGKKNRKGRKVSFDGKKAAKHTNSPK